MDLQTMKKQLLREIHIDTTTSGSVADTDVTLAIIESINYNRRYHLGWNEGQCVITTDASVKHYTLPSDFLGLAGEVLYSSSTSDSSTGKRRLASRPLSWVEANMNVTVDGADYINEGLPWAYAIDPKDKRIVLSPTPSSAGETLEFPYIKDCGTPEFKYTGSAWAFYKPGTIDTLTATYTNEYFSQGYWLIFNRASYILHTGVNGGTEEATVRAQSAIQRWAEELNRLRGEAVRIAGPRDVRPRL